jgi:hypothetical protein
MTNDSASRLKLGAQNVALGLAALLCFMEAFAAPKGSDPGPALTAVMGILLVRRAVIITPQSMVVIVAGCALPAIAIAGDRSLVNVNRIEWMVLTVIAGVCYGLWERIEKLWS